MEKGATPHYGGFYSVPHMLKKPLKKEVERMALLQFPKVCFSQSDEAEALAIAVCHMHTLKLNANLSRAIKKAM